MKYLFIAFFVLVSICFSQAQKKQAFVIYDKMGHVTSYEKMIKKIGKADITLFGEQHNSAVAHWLQIEVVKDAYLLKPLMLGAEMMEADNQLSFNQYLAGLIDQKGLDTSIRLWNNYKTDYAPLINFAKDSHIVFIATNIPRKYASLVYKRGFTCLDSLTDLEKSWMMPLPILYDSTLPGYRDMVKFMGGHGGPNMPKAQNVKDATMAYFILKNYKPNSLFIHFNGAYHSDHFEGILWHLKKKEPLLNLITISTVTQNDVSKLEKENLGKADFIICVDEDFTNTY